MDELTLAPGIVATDETLVIPELYTFDQWKTLGDVLRTIEKANQFWVGDWVNFGDDKFPDMVKQTAEELGYDIQTIRSYARVARKFVNAPRGASFSHYEAVASLAGPVADRLIEEAVSNKLSVRELEAEVREYKQEHTPAKSDPKKEVAFSWLKQDRVTDLIDHINTAMGTLRWMAKDQRDPTVAKYLIAAMNKMFHMLAEFTDHLLGSEVVAIPEEINALLEVNDDPEA